MKAPSLNSVMSNRAIRPAKALCGVWGDQSILGLSGAAAGEKDRKALVLLRSEREDKIPRQAYGNGKLCNGDSRPGHGSSHQPGFSRSHPHARRDTGGEGRFERCFSGHIPSQSEYDQRNRTAFYRASNTNRLPPGLRRFGCCLQSARSASPFRSRSASPQMSLNR